MQNILYKHRQQDLAQQSAIAIIDDVEPPITDLIAEIENKGFTIKSFARAAHLPEEVIEAFSSREVRFGSIVRQAIESVASLLGLPAKLIDNYLLRRASLQPSHWKADEPPQFSQMEFLELIEHAHSDFSDADKKYWLSQKPQESDLSE